MKAQEYKSFGEVPPPDTSKITVPCGMLWYKPHKTFKGEPAVGFNGVYDKTGIIVAAVGNTGSRDDFARCILQFSGGKIIPYKDGDGETGRVVKSPFLSTSVFFRIFTTCKEHGPVMILKPKEVTDQAEKVFGIRSEKPTDALNRMTACPVCGHFKITDWSQVDPFDQDVLKMIFNDPKGDEGERKLRELLDLLRPVRGEKETDEEWAERVERSRKATENPLRIPAVVAETRQEYCEEHGQLPEGVVYDELVRQADVHVDDDGNPDPYSLNLLNNLDPKKASVTGLNFAAEDMMTGHLPYDFLDKGFDSRKGEERLPYNVKIQVFLRNAASGLPPQLKSHSWSLQTRRNGHRFERAIVRRNSSF